MQSLKKQKEQIQHSQLKEKIELESLQNRMEHLQKEINMFKIQIKNQEAKKIAQIEVA